MGTVGFYPRVHLKGSVRDARFLSTVIPFWPFLLGVSLSKLNIKRKGTLIINGLLRNLV